VVTGGERKRVAEEGWQDIQSRGGGLVMVKRNRKKGGSPAAVTRGRVQKGKRCSRVNAKRVAPNA